MERRVRSFFIILMLSLSLPVTAQNVPQNFTIEGRLFDNVGNPINTNVDIKLEVLVQGDVNQCVFYRDTYSNVDLSSTDADTEGVFSLRLGASGAAYLSSSAASFNQVFSRTTMNGDANGDGTENGSDSTCAGRATPVSSPRLVRISVSPASANTYTTLSPDTILTSTPTALVADTLRGYTPDQFVGITADVTQAKLDTTYNTTNWTKLQALLNGTSTDYMDSVPTAAVSFNSQRITNLAAPTAADEATNKQYVDGKIGGLNLQVTGVGLGSGGGSTLVWDQVDNRWEVSDGSALTNLNATRLQSRFVSAAAPTDAQVLSWNNTLSQWEPRTASFTDTGMTQLTGDVVANGSGSVAATISNGAVTSAKIFDGTIATADIANSQITSAKINNTGIAVGRLLITDASTGATVTYSTCAQDEILKFNSSTGWGCATSTSLLGNTAVTAGSYGAATSIATFTVDAQGRLTAAGNVAISFPVTSVAGRQGAISLTTADIDGLGTAATRAVGNAVNDVVALSAANTLPSLDGSNLSNLNAVRLQGRVVSSASPGAGQVLAWNGTTSQWEPTAAASAPVTSVNGKVGVVTIELSDIAGAGDITAVNSGAGLLGGATSGVADLSVNVGTGANQIVQLNGSAFLPAVDGNLLTNLNAVRIQGRPVSATAPADLQVLQWNATQAQWIPVAIPSAPVTSVSVTAPVVNAGTASAPIIGVSLASTTSAGIVTLATDGEATAGEVVQASDTRLSNSRAPNGTAGGDLTGNYPNPTVANGTITSTKIADGTIDTIDIANNAVTNAKINDVAISKLTYAPGLYFAYRPNNTVCANDEVLKWNTSYTGWACGTDNNTGSGDVTDVNAGTGITVLGSTGPVVTVSVDVGTTPNKIVQLNANAFLPAVDGNLVTNLNAVRIQGRPVATTAPANTNHVLKWNGSAWESSDISTSGIFLPLTGGSLSGGLTVTAGGVRVNAGGLNVVAGATSLAGPLTVSSGGAGITGGGSFTGGLTVTSGNLNMNNNSILNMGPNISSFGSLNIQPNSGNNNVTVNSMGSGVVNLGGQSGPSLVVLNGGAAAGNYISAQGAAVGSAPSLRANGGTDANVNLALFAKGTGNVGVGTTTPFQNFSVYSASDVSLGVTTAASNSSILLETLGGDGSIEYSSVTGGMSLGVNGGNSIFINNSGRVAINQASAPNNAALEIVGTTTGNSAIIVPRAPTAARPTGVNGMIRYNTTLHLLEGFQGGTWLTLSGTGSAGGGGSLTWPLEADAGGSVGAPSYTFNGDTDSGIWSPANGAMGFSSNGVEQVRIDGAGTTFHGNVMSEPYDAGTSGSINFVNGTIQTTSFDCGAGMTLANLNNGGNYTLVVTGTGTNACSFSGSGVTTWRWVPPSGLRQAGSHTIYNLFRVGTTVYVSWTTGY